MNDMYTVEISPDKYNCNYFALADKEYLLEMLKEWITNGAPDEFRVKKIKNEFKIKEG